MHEDSFGHFSFSTHSAGGHRADQHVCVCEDAVDISKYKGRAPKTVKEDVAQWLLNYDHITRGSLSLQQPLQKHNFEHNTRPTDHPLSWQL